MFKFLPLYIASRYIASKRKNRFISFTALMSVLGIALGNYGIDHGVVCDEWF